MASSGRSNRDIASAMGRSHTTIGRFLNDPEAYGTKRRPGRPKKISLRDGRAIINATRRDSGISSSEIKRDTGVSASPRSIRRFLRAKKIKRKKRLTRPALTRRHKERRLEFARRTQTWTDEWNSILWSDEKKFNLDGPDGYQYYWHDPNLPEEMFSRRASGGGSVMIWGAFGRAGKLDLQCVETRMNAVGYQRMLSGANLRHRGREICGRNWTFMQDNAPIHKARSTMQWLEDEGIEVLEWPACSPDLNPIENLWGVLAGKVYAHGRQYSNKEDLKRAIFDAWDAIPLSTLESLVDSMPNRIFDVISKHGSATKY